MFDCPALSCFKPPFLARASSMAYDRGTTLDVFVCPVTRATLTVKTAASKLIKCFKW